MIGTALIEAPPRSRELRQTSGRRVSTAHGPSPAPTKTCSVPAGHRRKSHDDHDALAVQDEEVLLDRSEW